MWHWKYGQESEKCVGEREREGGRERERGKGVGGLMTVGPLWAGDEEQLGETSL